MKANQTSDDSAAELDGESDPTLQELLANGVEHVKKLDALIHEELSHKPEAVAEWDAIMREYADVFAEHEKKAEEEKLAREIKESMDRLSANVDRIAARDPTDLEVEGEIAQTFADWHELDAIIRVKCVNFPDQLAKWEEVMDALRQTERMFEAGVAAENAQPEN